MIDLDAIKSHNLISDYLRSLGREVKNEKRAWCPSCQWGEGHDNHRMALAISRDQQHYKCFGCGVTGDIITMVEQMNDCDFKGACEILGGEDRQDPQTALQKAQERAKRQEERLQKEIEQASRILEELRRARKHVEYNKQMTAEARGRWEKWGVPQFWQDHWQLGYEPEYSFWHDGKEYRIPTMTIPLFAPGWELLNIKHRLLGAPNGEKYRQERSGLPAQPWLADPDRPIGGRTLVVEGEKKGMVAYLTVDDPELCVIGIPGKTPSNMVIEQLKDCDPIYLCLDPDAQEETRWIAERLGKLRCRIIELPEKIDDLIIRLGLGKSWAKNLFRQAVRI